ncbi:MAG: cation transporter [Betaproteobacteria bacterium]|nr:cation transporter [Betaproteobacteria bacterium]
MTHPHSARQRHGHAHNTGHGHAHEGSTLMMPLALALTLGFAAVEAVAGWWAGSLALLGDAGHMLTDSLALALAAVAAWLSRRPPSPRHSFGLARVEVLAALLNAGFMGALVTALAWSAIGRLAQPRAVAGEAVTLVAAAGLAINLLVGWLLSRGEQTLNRRAALLHVVGDLLGSLAAMVAGVVISLTGWTPIDPLLSLFIGALILASTVGLAREAIHTLLEGVPPGMSLETIGLRMAALEGVDAVHDLHVWAVGSRQVALSAHVVVRELSGWETLRRALAQAMDEEFGIGHVTLQPELAPVTRVPVSTLSRGEPPQPRA